MTAVICEFIDGGSSARTARVSSGHEWEKAASLDLRHGRPEAVDAYLTHERVHNGDTDAMMDAAHRVWRHDNAAGKSSVLVADNTYAVRALNARARAERLLARTTHEGAEVRLIDWTRASAGDWVVTAATTDAYAPEK